MNRRLLKQFIPLALVALSPLGASAQMLPGRHPAYLHALTDLRTARWLLEHQSGDTAVYRSEDVAITEIDATIDDIKRSSIDDRKDLRDHPGVDVQQHGSRLLRSIEMLRKARADIDQEEDNPETGELRRRAREHLDRAVRAAEVAHDAWLKEGGG